jgi:hypothetical protein
MVQHFIMKYYCDQMGYVNFVAFSVSISSILGYADIGKYLYVHLSVMKIRTRFTLQLK